jgi:hypothetical protein
MELVTDVNACRPSLTHFSIKAIPDSSIIKAIMERTTKKGNTDSTDIKTSMDTTDITATPSS